MFCKRGSVNYQGNTCARVTFLIKLLVWACNFIKKEALAQVVSGEFCKIFKTSFFIEHFPWLLLYSVRKCILKVNHKNTKLMYVLKIKMPEKNLLTLLWYSWIIYGNSVTNFEQSKVSQRKPVGFQKLSNPVKLISIGAEKLLLLKNVVRCAIWYHFYNLKTWKTTMEECYF